MRRFHAGDTFRVAGIDFRVVAGAKKQNGTGEIGRDLRLDWRTPVDGWVAVPMRAAALLADFFYENEETLYPRQFGYKGGGYFRDYLRHAWEHGWDKADAGLRAERAMKPSLFDVGDDCP